MKAFSDSDWAKDHAWKWALNHFNDYSQAVDFVDWLTVQTAEDQAYIFEHGYDVCADRFEKETSDPA